MFATDSSDRGKDTVLKGLWPKGGSQGLRGGRKEGMSTGLAPNYKGRRIAVTIFRPIITKGRTYKGLSGGGAL